jgi:hypothetical protein
VVIYLRGCNFSRRASSRANVQNSAVVMETIHRPTVSKHGKTLEGVKLEQLLGIGNFGTISGYFGVISPIGEVFLGSWNRTPVALKKIKPEYYHLFKKESDTLMYSLILIFFLLC